MDYVTFIHLVLDGDVFMWLSPFQLNHYHLNQLINGEWLHVEVGIIILFSSNFKLCISVGRNVLEFD